MSLEYVRKTYRVPAKRGGRVKFKFKGALCYGRILSASHHVKVEPDDAPGIRLSFHPTDLTYL